MRHLRHRRKLSAKTNHRKAMVRNMVRNLVIHKQVRTTVTKARVASAAIDRMVQIAKRGDLQARRLLISKIGCADTAKALIQQVAPHFKERQGGYTRVLRLGFRPGDGADTALLEFTETIDVPSKEKKAKKKKAKSEKAEKAVEAAPKAKTVEKPKTKTDSAKKAEKAETAEDKKETEKRGGFLGTLRKFLKGDEQ